MDLDDEMECKSAASWNPKFDFEPGGSNTKESVDLKLSSKSSLFHYYFYLFNCDCIIICYL